MDVEAITNIVLFCILFMGAAIGFAKGFLEQAVEFLGAVGALIVAILLAGWLARLIDARTSLPYSTTLVVASIILFFACLLVAHLLARSIGRVVKMTLLGWVDRLAGAGLGLVVAMILSSLLITLALELPFPRSFQKDVQRAPVSLFVRPIAGQIYNFIVAHGSGAVRFEEIFKEGETI
jgi:membrane protein required for colicin V production